MSYLVWCWHRWRPVDGAAEWLASLLGSTGDTLDILRGFVRTGTVVSNGAKQTHKFFPIRDVEPLISIDELDASARKLDERQLTQDDKEVLAAVHEAIARRRAGKSDSPFDE
jgi:hypothetical protein